MQIKSITIAAAMLLTTVLLSGCGEPAGPKLPGKYAEVARCLTQKGVIMYGAYWCPHCLSQKKLIGDDFQFIKYQECDDAGTDGNHKLCIEKGVTSYPTWIFPGQGSLAGEQQMGVLAKLANCEDKLPQEDKDKLKKAEEEAAKAAAAKPADATATPTATTTAPGATTPTTEVAPPATK